MASTTQWTWVWANSRRQWRTEKPAIHGVAKSQTWQRLNDKKKLQSVCVVRKPRDPRAGLVVKEWIIVPYQATSRFVFAPNLSELAAAAQPRAPAGTKNRNPGVCIPSQLAGSQGSAWHQSRGCPVGFCPVCLLWGSEGLKPCLMPPLFLGCSVNTCPAQFCSGHWGWREQRSRIWWVLPLGAHRYESTPPPGVPRAAPFPSNASRLSLRGPRLFFLLFFSNWGIILHSIKQTILESFLTFDNMYTLIIQIPQKVLSWSSS